MNPRTFAHDLLAEHRDEIMQVVQDLIRMPSRNMPPGGEELAWQEYLARYLGRAISPTELYDPNKAPGMVEHPSSRRGRDYHNRPNLHSRLPRWGGGRSLLLTGHIDTGRAG